MAGHYEFIICEKPSQALKIAEALADTKPTKKVIAKVSYYELTHKGKKIVVGCAIGHLYTLAEKNKKAWHYPVFDYEWKPTYEVNKEAKFSKAYLDVLIKLAKNADEYTIACDFDNEGSTIGWNILQFVCHQKDAKRMKFSTLTKDELIDSYEHASPHLDFHQIESGVTRHGLDWLWGLNLTRALTLSVKTATGKYKLLSIGRVQGPALKFLRDREVEIQAFKPEPYWEVPLIGIIHDKDLLFAHDPEQYTKKADADAVLVKVKGKSGVVDNLERRQTHQKPPFPFDLTSLQIEAYGLLGLSPHRTLEIAQDLYSNGWISYPRTSSQQLPESLNFKKILTGLSKAFPKEVSYLLDMKKLVPNNGKKQDPAHPAIHPTGDVPKRIEDKAKGLYELIDRRFFATFGEDAIRESTSITIHVNKEPFVTRGTRTIHEGWFSLYRPFVRLDEEELPEVDKGLSVTVKDVHLDAKETQPPKRYTEASIIKELEKRNLGTKATRATILQNLYDRNYVNEKSIHVTDLGMKTIATLEKYCPDILNEELTREFEDDMEKIYANQLKGDKIIANAKIFLEKTLTTFKKHEKEIGGNLEEAAMATLQQENHLGQCPNCKEGSLQMRRGKFGLFAACSKYPDCKTTFSLPKSGKVKPTDKLCTQCQFPMVQIFRAKRKPQLSCINPQCPTKKAEEEKLNTYAQGRKCPNCDSVLVVKKSFYGYFLACPKYPACKHIENVPKTEEAEEKA